MSQFRTEVEKHEEGRRSLVVYDGGALVVRFNFTREQATSIAFALIEPDTILANLSTKE